MSKVINYFGELDDGGVVLDLQLSPKRISNFKPFELRKYRKIQEKIEKENESMNDYEKVELIDKLLFDESKNKE